MTHRSPLLHRPAALRLRTGPLAGPVALVAALAVGVPALAQDVLPERLIRNIARATFLGGTGVTSNEVLTRVPADRPDAPPVLDIATPGGPGAPVRPGIGGPTRCLGTSGPVAIEPRGAFAGLMTGATPLDTATRLVAGEPIVLSFRSASLNRDPARADTVEAQVAFSNGDAETLIFQEDGVDTGRFVAVLTTIAMPPAAVPGDCALSLEAGGRIGITVRLPDGTTIASPRDLPVAVPGRSYVFDSGTGDPVPGVRMTLVDAETGAVARQYAADGASSDAIVTTGPDGAYVFGFTRPGRYRLVADPPAPFTAPSRTRPDALAGFDRPDGDPYRLVAGSYGDLFTISGGIGIIDVPIDRPGAGLDLTKLASVPVAAAGDPVGYTIVIRNPDPARTTGAVTVTDILPPGLSVRLDTVRLDGRPIRIDAPGADRRLTIPVPALPAGGSARLTYVADIGRDAGEGTVINRAEALDDRGNGARIAEAAVRITREAIADRMTIVGRIRDGGCATHPDKARGVPGIRVMLPDGRYTATDSEGRYHFEGLRPGTHVVAIDPVSVPAGLTPIDCTRTVRSAGSATSRFVDGIAGITYQADFAMAGDAPVAAPARLEPAPDGGTRQAETASPEPEDPGAAAYRTDWHAAAGPDVGFLFPTADHNPRARGVLVAIRHKPAQRVTLALNGEPVPALSFEGASLSPDGRSRVSVWRGITLGERANRLTATVAADDGSAPVTLTRDLHVAGMPVRAVMLPERSRLVADGVTVPLLAVRLFDRDGKPVRHGTTGSFTVGAPYSARMEVEAQAERQLAGLERMGATWQVQGDDGVAMIALEPTLASGSLPVSFSFRTEATTRTQRVTAWMSPGDRPWTLVGFAEGTVGFGTVSRHVRPEHGRSARDDFSVDGRVALYAKGRVLGKWLLTIAYDSDRRRDATRFGGVIEPDAYYTVYADRTATRHDAASVEKLYVRLDRPNFTAAFGDFDTGLDETELARYNRAMTGVRAQYGDEQLRATAFAAETATRHVRDELQGLGLTGPYALSRRDILPNSDVVVIETRDRLRAERIVTRRPLARLTDYDIDYVAGTVRLRSPLLSRDPEGNPQFLVVDFETDGRGRRVLNAGGRVSWRDADDRVRLGATVLHDRDERGTTDLAALDARVSIGATTEVRAEVAASRARGDDAVPGREGTATAFSVEADHRGANLDLLAYVRQLDEGFGLGQTNRGEIGTRKVGLDARYALGESFSVSGSAWHADALDRDATRIAARGQIEWRDATSSVRAGLTHAEDRIGADPARRSTLAQIGASKRLFDGALELDAQSDFAIGKARSTDFPARHRLSARYAVAKNAWLVGAVDWTGGGGRDDQQRSTSARAGIELTPWTGGRLTGTMIRQDLSENGSRTFAAYGLSQSLRVADGWTVDATIDGNRRLSGLTPDRVFDPAQPVVSGGFLSTGGLLTENFLALTAGTTLRRALWSVTGRGEVRLGEEADRYGLTLGAIRQMGEGTTAGARAIWSLADGKGGLATTETGRVEFSIAHRPDAGRIAILDKFEARLDRVSGATLGGRSPVGGAPLTVVGDVASRRVMNSFSIATTATADDEPHRERAEFGLFWGTRYVFDRYDGQDIDGWSNVVGLDARWFPRKGLGVGLVGSVRSVGVARWADWAVGPAVTLVPATSVQVELGYNIAGFDDRDFAESRATRDGAWLTVRAKFDATTLDALMGSR